MSPRKATDQDRSLFHDKTRIRYAKEDDWKNGDMARLRSWNSHMSRFNILSMCKGCSPCVFRQSLRQVVVHGTKIAYSIHSYPFYHPLNDPIFAHRIK